MKKFLSVLYVLCIFALLYAPIFVVILFSFNASGSLSTFTEFSLKWYRELFRDGQALSALKNSLILAVSSSLCATILGTLASRMIFKAKHKFFARAVETVSDVPMMNPDIVTGVSMMLLFVGVASFLERESFLGFFTMLIAHTAFNIPYVILSVLPKYRTLDKSLCEASLDLGGTPYKTFWAVEVPHIMPGILSGLLMGFTLSLDDFVISHFVSSPDFKTLPLYIYNQTAHEVKFSMYALCTLMIVVILAMLIVSNVIGNVDDSKSKRKEAVRS